MVPANIRYPVPQQDRRVQAKATEGAACTLFPRIHRYVLGCFEVELCLRFVGGADINKAAKYILWRFTQTNRARLSVYPHLTQATDTSNVSPSPVSYVIAGQADGRGGRGDAETRRGKGRGRLVGSEETSQSKGASRLSERFFFSPCIPDRFLTKRVHLADVSADPIGLCSGQGDDPTKRLA